MPAFDLNLTDPTVAAMEKAMCDAVDSANLRCRVGVLANDRGVWRKFLASEFPAAPEGVALWVAEKGRVDTFPPTPRATLLGVAWRTTPLGKRLVRVAGRRIEPFNENPSNRFGPPWRRWPALCHLDPDHVVVRTLAGGEPEAIALCDCGAVGHPDELGWMVGRCGPCHDRFEEEGAPLPGQPVVLRTEGQLTSVGFLPSGRSLAAAEFFHDQYSGTVHLAWWNRSTGACRSEPIPPWVTEVPALSGAAPGLLLSDGFRVLSVGEDGTLRTVRGPQSCVALAFAGNTATALTYSGEGWRRDLTAPDEWQSIWPERRAGRDIIYFALDVAPDGQAVALGRTECTVELFRTAGGEGGTLRPALSEEQLGRQRVFAVAFSPDGKLLAAGAGRSGFVEQVREQWWGRNGGIYLYDAAGGEYLAGFLKPNDDILALAFSPSGSLLFAGGTDCTIRAIDVRQREEIAVLEGHVGGVNALAFSPDGKTLASAGGDGLVRLWPWQALLRLPARKDAAGGRT